MRERVVELAALALHHLAPTGEARQKAKRLLADLEAQLVAGVMATARERGKTRPLDEAVAAILG